MVLIPKHQLANMPMENKQNNLTASGDSNSDFQQLNTELATKDHLQIIKQSSHIYVIVTFSYPCLPRSCRSNQHETVSDHGGLVQLDTLVDESFHIFQTKLVARSTQWFIQWTVVYWLLPIVSSKCQCQVFNYKWEIREWVYTRGEISWIKCYKLFIRGLILFIVSDIFLLVLSTYAATYLSTC